MIYFHIIYIRHTCSTRCNDSINYKSMTYLRFLWWSYLAYKWNVPTKVCTHSLIPLIIRLPKENHQNCIELDINKYSFNLCNKIWLGTGMSRNFSFTSFSRRVYFFLIMNKNQRSKLIESTVIALQNYLIKAEYKSIELHIIGRK